MRGQGKGRPKKMKVDFNLGGGHGEDDTTTGASVESYDDLRGNQKHPLLNELVMETLFKQYSLLNHDDSAKSVLGSLAELRLVCKAWNQEIGKIVRKQTHINVNRLISAYPNGLGWEATATEGDENDIPFKYSAPLPDEIGTFDNLDVTISTCEDLTSSSVVKWFQVMGSSVKSLRLTCSLICYHQNRFVESILKEWCPTLRSFTLRGVRCFESLIYNSFFTKPSLESQCSSLKEFVLSADHLSLDCGNASCGVVIEDLETTAYQPFRDFGVRTEIYGNLEKFVGDLSQYMEIAGEPHPTSYQEENLLTKLVRRPIGLTSLNGLSPRSFGSHIPEFFQQNFACDSGFEHDGGIIGQLMKMSRITKFVMEKQNGNGRQNEVFNALFAIFFYRPNLWRSSVSSFEFVGNCPAVTGGVRQRMTFSKLGFPLKTLKIDDTTAKVYLPIDSRAMKRILTGYAENLEELEIRLKNRRDRSAFSLPVMPKLKKLLVDMGRYRAVKVSCQDILEKFPKLERCYLKLGAMQLNFFFEDALRGGGFWGNTSHPLKELKLLDEYVDGGDIERITMWFPNLKIVDLSIGREAAGEDFKVFWEKMGELPLEQIKLTFSGKSSKGNAYGLYEKAIGDNIGGFRDLESLELVHEVSVSERPFPLTPPLSKKFTKAVKLRFLKLTNFQITVSGRFAGGEAQEIKENLANVVVQLPSVRSSARRMKRKLVNVD